MTTTIERGLERKLFSVNDLHPIMRAPIERLIASAAKLIWASKGRFEPFEGFRNPERQHHLVTIMKTTKAGPWQSAHQYGLAVDFAVRVKHNGSLGWIWPETAPWGELERLAAIEGLDIPIKWDRGHVQHPAFREIRNAWN